MAAQAPDLSEGETSPAAEVVRIDDLDRVRLEAGVNWRPLRRRLGVTAFGINAYTAEAAGDPLIERHDELASGAQEHEELYLVITGEARFEVGGDSLEAPAGTVVFIRDPAVTREAVATAPATTAVAIGGRGGAGLPVSPWEYWCAASPADEAGDYRRAVEIMSEGLAEHSNHPRLNFYLACDLAMAGDREAAIEHLLTAIAADPAVREWIPEEEQLAAVRDAPELQG